MTNALTTAIVGGLVLLMLGWIKLDLQRLADRIDRLEDRVDRLAERIDQLSDRVARIEGWIERERSA